MSETPKNKKSASHLEMACAINGADFLDIDESLYIEDVEEKPAMAVTTANRTARGQILLAQPAHDSIEITITFLVKKSSRAERMQVIQKVCGWAKEGWFTVAYRENQRIYVFPTDLPTVTAFKWSERLKLTLTAYYDAYWQAATPVQSTSGSITPGGTVLCYLEGDFTVSGGSLTLAANGRTMTFSCGNGALSIYYDEYHRLCVTRNGTSLLDKRTADSDDDILLNPGASNTVTVTGATRYTLKARGLWR